MNEDWSEELKNFRVLARKEKTKINAARVKFEEEQPFFYIEDRVCARRSSFVRRIFRSRTTRRFAPSSTLASLVVNSVYSKRDGDQGVTADHHTQAY